MKNIAQYIRYFLCGVVFGTANVIPGVSGGTMLVIFGIFDRLTDSISGVKKIISNLPFLLTFGIGAGAGILASANIISSLLKMFGIQTNMFFIGLILGGVPLIYKIGTSEKKAKPSCAVPFIIAMAIVIGFAVLEGNSGERVPIKVTKNDNSYTVVLTNNSGQDMESWSLELEEGENVSLISKNVDFIHKGGKLETVLSWFGKAPDDTLDTIIPKGETELKNGESVTFTVKSDSSPVFSSRYSVKVDFKFILVILLASIIAAMAMIIPGISGSFIMVLLGTYATVISAVKDFNFAVLIPFAIGALFGIVFGAKLISMLINKNRLMVYSALMGLVVGSVYAILPDGFGFNLDTGYGFVCLIIGVIVSVLIEKIGKNDGEETTKSDS